MGVPNKSKFKTKGEMYPLLKQGIVAPATGANVANGATVPVVNSAGTAVAGTHTATVTGTTLTNVKLAATVAPVINNATAPTQNSAGTVVGAASTLVVAAGAVTASKLPATSSINVNGVAQILPVTGVYVDRITPTVVNGVTTGYVLS